MDREREHRLQQIRLLRDARDGALPEFVSDKDPGGDYGVLEELLGADFIAARRNDTLAEHTFYSVKITLAGRKYLAELEQTKPDQATDPADSEPPNRGKYRHEWHKNPWLIVGLIVVGGVLVVLTTYLIRQHLGIAL